MARFRAFIEGRFGNQAKRLGDDMALAEITGAKAGVFVEALIDPEGHDLFRIYATKGREGQYLQYLGDVQLTEGRVTFTPKEGA